MTEHAPTHALRFLGTNSYSSLPARPNAFIEISRDRVIRRASTAFARLFEYAPWELRGKPCGLLNAQSAERCEPPGQRIGASEAASHEEIWRTKSGRPVEVRVVYVPIVRFFGGYRKWLAVVTDISAEMDHAADLASRASALEKGQFVIDISCTGTILSVNSRFLSALGYGLEEVQGRDLKLVFDHTYPRSGGLQQICDSVCSGKPQDALLRVYRKDGESLYVRATLNPILSRRGALTSICILAYDATQDLALESRCIEARSLFRSGLDSTSEVIARIAMDADLLARDARLICGDVATVKSCATSLDSSSDRIINEIDQMLSSSAESAKKAEVAVAVVTGLRSSATKVEEVVDLIRLINERTHMLALNASIEAGWHGQETRGFTVVAQEVKVLAAQTEQATRQISYQIAEMRREAQAALDAMSEIQGAIGRSNDLSLQVAALARMQGGATFEVARAMMSTAEKALALKATLGRISSAANAIDVTIRKVNVSPFLRAA